MIYSNVMIDLETMGQGPDAAIVAIGAVAFDITSREIGPTYYHRITLESAMSMGGKADASTIIWWLQQSDEARHEITRPDGQVDLPIALQSFSRFMAENAEPEAEVYGCGSDFDNVILATAYQRAGLDRPWKWWRNRCYRTIKSMHRDVKIERIGTHHNALSDAYSQAQHLIAILNPEHRT